MPAKLLQTLMAAGLAATATAAAAESGDQFSGIKKQLAAEQQAIQSAELKRLIEIERAKLTEGLKRLEALEGQQQVRAALRPDHRVDLVHDHRLDVAQRLPRP